MENEVHEELEEKLNKAEEELKWKDETEVHEELEEKLNKAEEELKCKDENEVHEELEGKLNRAEEEIKWKDENEVHEELEEKLNKAEEELKWKDEQFKHLEEAHEKLNKAEDELKWKDEQLKHLEEAQEKLRDEFNKSKSEWETEKSFMVQEIKKLNGSLDGECSTAEAAGEDGIANPRHSSSVKEIECKDLQYKAKKLEAENRDLLASIKKLREARIPKGVTSLSSWVKLRTKLRNLEQTNRDCSASFKVKEFEWNSRAKKMTSELNRCSSSLQIRDQVIDQLKYELDDCHSLLTQLKKQNEELCLKLELMKLDMENSFARQRFFLERELIDKTNEIRDLEFEALEWKMLAENMKDELEVSFAVRNELELSLLDQTELEEILKQDVEDKNQRISNLQHQIVLMDQEIMIKDENTQVNESTSIRWQAEDDEDEEIEYDEDEDSDEHEQDLLAKELEIAIINHIMEENGRTKGTENVEGTGLKVRVGSTLDDETCSIKDNVVRVNSSTKMGESFIEDSRSPFREVN